MGEVSLRRPGSRAPAACLALLGLCGLAAALVAPSAATAACPNEALRTGPSANLPDCRAYELVSPADSNGRKLRSVALELDDEFPTEPVSPQRDSFVFSTELVPLQSPGGALGGSDIYEAERSGAGWRVVRHVTPSGDETILPFTGGLSSDHAYSLVHVGPFLPQSGTEFGSLYQGSEADYLGDREGNFGLTGCGSLGCEKLVQGRYISPGGEHVIFTTGKLESESRWCDVALHLARPCKVIQLEPSAPPEGTGAVYDRSAAGPTKVVSLLPGPTDPTPGAGEDAVYQGVSKDGTTVAFKIGTTMYVRVPDAEGGHTLEVTEGDPVFAGLSDNGRYLFYVAGGESGDIHRFDTSDESDEQLNSTGDGQVVNVSADGSHVYFTSEQQLDGSEGTAGQPNLYVWSGGSPNYIATVLPADLALFANWTKAVFPFRGRGPGMDQSRTTPDGSAIVFAAKAQLTPPYDNAGHTEIYRWAEADESLLCVSCNPEGAPAGADARLQDVPSILILHNLSDDGGRVFFETEEALVEGDVGGTNDVYEWQEPEGSPEVDLISSGSSAQYDIPSTKPNVLMGVKPDGSEVFFGSLDALAPGAGEGGVPAIYDARIGGGFAPPPAPPICLEEGCRAPLSPPPLLGGAASSALRSAGNVVPKKKHKKRHERHRRCARAHHCARKRAKSSASASFASLGRAPTAEAPVPAADVSSGDAPAEPFTRESNQPLATPLSLSSEWEKYGIKSFSVKASTPAAARHPDLATRIVLNPEPFKSSPKTENIIVDLPPGIYGNPNLTPRCATGKFLSSECPIDSQVGVSRVRLAESLGEVTYPLYNLAPPHPEAEIARFGVTIVGIPTYIDVSVRTASDYGVTAAVYDAPGEAIEIAETVIWGNPADESHDELRMTPGEATECSSGTACKAPGGKRRPEELGPIAFMTNPSACQQGKALLSVTSYQLPGRLFSKSALLPAITDCQGLPFAPSLEARPTTDVAGAPTGLHSKLLIPQSSDPSQPSTATMREARVILPEGMAINPGAADGLAACSDEEVHFHEEVDAQCPDASKLGSATIESPALLRPLQGALYQRSPGEKGHLFRLWLVSDDFGLHIKIPGEIKPNSDTGQLTAVFADLPQVPVGEIDLDVWGGARAPLKNPDTCGTYETTSALFPHSEDPPATPSDRFLIDRGPGGGPCPTTASGEPNSPEFEAGTETPVSATYSPFDLRLRREDGSQAFGTLTLTLPPGLTGRLSGLGECSDAALAAAAARSGAEEKSNPSCPAAGLLGTVWAAAGAGPAPFWAKGNAYLAGPYKGAPLSVAIITPAVAGPFDLGTVVVRSALRLEPESARITVKSDPIPSILEGVPLNLRTVAVNIDRQRFTLNGTSCEPLAFQGTLLSTLGNAAPLKERFQLGECSRLKFKPRLSLALKGPAERAGFPALRATYRARTGDADLKRLTLRFPRSEFIEQGHFRTICTRVRWVAGAGGGTACPKGSVYGHIRAFTPLLDKPLAGPVYLRSSDHNLPDIVFALRGRVDAEVAVRIDSLKGGLQARIEEAPDVPIAKAVLNMQGGQKGLFVNSRDTCAHVYRATVGLEAHNGRALEARPELEARCGGSRKHAHHRHGHRADR